MFAKKHDEIYHECTECRCFVWCESPKQWYHKVCKTPCDDFEFGENIKARTEVLKNSLPESKGIK